MILTLLIDMRATLYRISPALQQMLLDIKPKVLSMFSNMRGSVPKNKRIVLFENGVLEKLTVISVGWFVAIWAVLLPIIAVFVWGSASPLVAGASIIVGSLVWSLFEYFAHRKLFHFEAKSPAMKKFAFVLHGNHHAEPNDKLRGLLPPIVSIPIACAVWALFRLIAGDAGNWAFLGFICCYVFYDLTHYACHNWPMRSALGKRFKRHHLRHHYVSNDGNFGVTALFWDHLFGTTIVSKAPSSSTDGRIEVPAEPAE